MTMQASGPIPTSLVPTSIDASGVSSVGAGASALAPRSSQMGAAAAAGHATSQTAKAAGATSKGRNTGRIGTQCGSAGPSAASAASGRHVVGRRGRIESTKACARIAHATVRPRSISVGGVTGAVRRRKGRTNSASLLGASLGLCLSGSAAGAPQANALKPTPALPAAPLNAPTPAPTPTGTPDSTLATLVGPTSARTAEQGSCDPGWATRVYAETRASVVRIENAEGLGTGFIAFTPKYVATAFHV